MTKVEKWVCGETFKGKIVVRQVFAKETEKQFIVERNDPEINSLLGYLTRIHKLDMVLFDSAYDAVKHRIGKVEAEINRLKDLVAEEEAKLKELDALLVPR